MVEDKLLIWKFKCGNRDALGRIYGKYKNYLLKLAIVLANDTNTAEDVVHDVFVSFVQSAAKIRLAGNLKSYLSTCVVNRIRNRKRDEQRHEAVGIENSDRIISDSVQPERWAILSEQLGILSGAMAQLLNCRMNSVR